MAKNNSNLHGAKKAKNDEFYCKNIVFTLLFFMLISIKINAHNVHYPTYSEDGITYQKSSVSDVYIDGCWYEHYDIVKVNKPYDKTITIPYMPIVNGKKVVVFEIRENAFSPCVSLDSLIISDGLYLRENTFIGCRELEYLYYSSNTSAWGLNNKYTYYPGLSCKTLETSYGCLETTFWTSVEKSLEKLIIKETSKTFFTYIDNCKKLKTVICYSVEPPSTGSTSSPYSYGGGCGHEKFASYQWSTITLYVPRESLEKYYFHRVWGEIDNIYAIDEMNSISTHISHVNNVMTTNDLWYSLDGKRKNNPTKGVYIKNGKKYYLK